MRKLPLLLLTFSLSLFSYAQTTPSAPSSSTNRTAPATPSSGYVLPAETKIEVRINEALSSETSQQGDRFTGTVENDVVDASGRTLIPRNATVNGRVLSASPSGRLSNSGELQLSINTIRVGSSMINVTVEPFVDQGESHTKSNTTKVGGGAALGAIIGAIAGGGKGAAIGAGVGGAAGAGAAAATGKKPAEIKPEALLTFVTATTTTVPAAVAQGTVRPASTSASANQSQSSSNTSSTTSNTSTRSEPFPSSSTPDDKPPVLQRREGGAVTTPSTSSTTPSSTSSTTPSSSTTSTGSYGSPTTPSTGSTTTNPTGSSYPNGTGTSTSAGNTSTTYPPPTSGSASSASSQLLMGRSFSARDRRVINNCVREHSASLPDAALRKTAATRTFTKDEVISVDTNRLLRALPLSCDRELPALSNDLERVIYGGQVMLLDNTSRVLDVFTLTP